MFLYQIQIEPENEKSCGCCSFSVEEADGGVYCSVFSSKLAWGLFSPRRCDKCKQAEQDAAK